jgi:signal transduction histidine kinase
MSERAEKLIASGLALSRELRSEAILTRIVELAAELTGARYAALGVLNEDRNISEFITHGVTHLERAAIGDPPSGKGLLGLLIDERRPIRIDDIAADPHSHGFPPNHPPMGTFLGAPVVSGGSVFGNIYLTEKAGGVPFTEEDERDLVVLASQAGIAIYNARLLGELQRANQEIDRLSVSEERERIAKELHDGVIQSLFAVGMGLQGASALTEDGLVSTRIEGAIDEIDRAIRDLRNYIFGLRPGILADRQLAGALKELVDEFQERTGVVAVADIDDEAASELASVATDVVQVAREALSNVAKHSGASTCSVRLHRTIDGVTLEVDDDGDGFDMSSISKGMGLQNMSRRLEALGGSFSVAAVAGEGTTVTATFGG